MDTSEVPDSGSAQYHGTPFGGDPGDSKTHVIPAPPLPSKMLPGENCDPRFDSWNAD